MLSHMPVENAPRQLLPQQMANMQQTINLGLPEVNGGQQRENQRNYVFVDEHNRHKRLKVMRACEGCRRRKIKCDAATTNTWPCSACIRLKLQCVPPMAQYDREFSAGQGHSSQEPLLDFEGSSPGADDDFLSDGHGGPRKLARTSSMVYARDSSNGFNPHSPHSPQHNQIRHHSHSGEISYVTMGGSDHVDASLSAVHFQTPAFHPHSPPAVAARQAEEFAANDEMAAALVGQLRIDDTGVASYISAQNRRLAENPAYEPAGDEVEPNNPSYLSAHHEYAVQIRPEDYPSEPEAAEMFNIFFNHCHPYLPIVNKAVFMRQWESNAREQISPLLLEAIFACAGRLMTDPGIGLKWIARATKHVDCFMDVPRLSTVQALLILMKARESAPQRGYFFRSWIGIVTIIAMARDLGLDTHHEIHQKGLPCGHSPIDCMTRTRVWQACFSYELMISAPQGRETMQCSPDSIDDTVPPANVPELELDEQEYCNHRNFVHLIRLVKNIRRMVDVHVKLKEHPSWRNDPQFMKSAPSLDKWLSELPPDLLVEVNPDLNEPSPDVGNSHFTGNMQVYYHLARTMLHRPALAYGKTFTAEGEWRHHMSICSNSAKAICRLEEVIFRDYGMLGLQCMNRGVNFSIYTLLTGAMIHLVAATCPHPEFNHDAREYFTRTMRLLENCIDNSASQEVKGQIETLREAFSVDLSRPFVLNPSFPFYPGAQAHMVEAQMTSAYVQADAVQASTLAPNSQVNFSSYPISPPYSTDDETRDESPGIQQPIVMVSSSEGTSPAAQAHALTPDEVQWNPSQLFNNWNAAFGVQSNPNGAPIMQHAGNTYVESLGGATPRGGHPPSANHPSLGAQCLLVSPGMWKDSVAAATVFTAGPHPGASSKRPFPFGGGDGWTQNPPQAQTSHLGHGGHSMRTPPGTAGGLLHPGGSPQRVGRH